MSKSTSAAVNQMASMLPGLLRVWKLLEFPKCYFRVYYVALLKWEAQKVGASIIHHVLRQRKLKVLSPCSVWWATFIINIFIFKIMFISDS